MRYAMVNFYNLQLLDKMRRNVFSLRGNISHRKEASYLACYQLLAIKMINIERHLNRHLLFAIYSLSDFRSQKSEALH